MTNPNKSTINPETGREREAYLDVGRVAISGISPAGERQAYWVRPDLFDTTLAQTPLDQQKITPGALAPAASVRAAAREFLTDQGYGEDVINPPTDSLRRVTPQYRPPIYGNQILNPEAIGDDQMVVPLEETSHPETGEKAWAVMAHPDPNRGPQDYDPHVVAELMTPYVQNAAFQAIADRRS